MEAAQLVQGDREGEKQQLRMALQKAHTDLQQKDSEM